MNTQEARINMVSQQLRTGDVLNKNILSLYADIPREAFVPSQFQQFAYSDMQIQLPHEQRMLTPLEEGKLLQALDLKGHEVVLEVGTGSGFLTALLSHLAKKVISVDYFSDFTTQARVKLAAHQCTNVELHTGDAWNGWVDQAPYDVLVITGAMESLTETLRLQVVPGGKIVAIVGKDPVMQAQLHTLNHQGEWQVEVLFETQLPALITSAKPNDFVF